MGVDKRVFLVYNKHFRNTQIYSQRGKIDMRDMQLLKECLKKQVIPRYFRWWWKHWMWVAAILTGLGWAATILVTGAVICLAMFL